MSKLRFTGANLNEYNKKDRILRKAACFDNKVIVTNGFNACGKTLVSPLLSSIERVLAMTTAYEIEWCSAFLYSNKMDESAYSEFVKLYVDNTIYDHMMGRKVNCRPSDLSSIFRYKGTMEYIRRMFRAGDNEIPPLVNKEQPILSLFTNNLLPLISPLSRALADRLLFIEVVRDPMYMYRQLSIFMETIIIPDIEKYFTLKAYDRDKESYGLVYLDYFSDESVFTELSDQNTAMITVSYLERMFDFYMNIDFSDLKIGQSTLMILPFEKFVETPDLWLKNVLQVLGADWTDALKREMKRQNVPRKIWREGPDLPIYRRFGLGGKQNLAKTQDKDIERVREDVKKLIADDVLYKRIEKLSYRYYEWIDSFNEHFVFSNDS